MRNQTDCQKNTKFTKDIMFRGKCRKQIKKTQDQVKAFLTQSNLYMLIMKDQIY